MPRSLNADAKKAIKDALNGVTSVSEKTGTPGLVFVAVDKDGTYLAEEVSGTVSLDSTKPMTQDSVFWIASCTKMITGLACMQLVEQGKLELDSSEHLYNILPELRTKKVLEDAEGTMSEKNKEITLRMLLTHTAGFGYSIFNPKLRDYGRPTGFNELSSDRKDILMLPLVNQPGSRFEYGTNIDWVGLAVERVSGMTLDAYFKKHIFEPLQVQDISFIPSKDMIKNQVGFQQRHRDSSVHVEDHPYRRAIWLASEDEGSAIMHLGGAGLFAKPREYAKIIATLLNNGVSPTTGNRILSEKSIEECFTNQIPQFPDYGRQPTPAAKPMYTYPIPEIYPQEGNPPQGWGITFMITIEPGPTGRGRNTGWWAGLTNQFWWADREKGVGGIIAAQILPFGDPAVMGAWFACEAAVYQGLE